MSDKPLANINLVNYGLFATHDMPCAVCLNLPAVFDCNKSLFQPCWSCQQRGYEVRKRRWFFWSKP